MALTNNFISPTSLVFNPRDFAQQLAQQQTNDSQALKNAFSFITNAYDMHKNTQIANEMQKENPDYKKIDSLAAQRINSPDTSFSNWRWKQGQDFAKAEADLNRAAAKEQREQDLKRIELEKAKAKEDAIQNMKYKIDAQLKPMNIDMSTTNEDLKQWINTLAALESEAQSANVGEDYLNKIWDKQKSFGLGNALPSVQAGRLMNDFDVLSGLFDIVEKEGGFGKNKEKYKQAIKDKFEEIEKFYNSFGEDIPLEVTKKFQEVYHKFDTKKNTPKKGALSKF